MAKINIKQPKYIIPLVMLPFIFIIGYGVSTFNKGKKDNSGLVSKEELNIELQDAPGGETGSKIDALRNRFRKEGDFSGIQNVDLENDQMTENSGSLYATDEMIYIDSINQISKIKEEEIKRMTQRYIGKDYTQSELDSISQLQNTQQQPTTVSAQNQRTQPNFGQQTQQDSTFEQKRDAAYQKEMQRVYKQMRSIDSMRAMAAQQQQEALQPKNVENQDNSKNNSLESTDSPVSKNGKTSLVRKSNTAASFNTLSNNESSDGIVAMLDETVTVRGSSRIRIRLLEDVAIDNMILKKGDYVYGIVSGINGQRVTISVKSIMIKGKIYNTDLVVYDNDGMEGFFIPDNFFREITKEIGANTVSQTNFTIENGTETWQSLVYKTLNNVIRQLTSSIGKTIRQPKATLKYNTQIYLYNKNNN